MRPKFTPKYSNMNFVVSYVWSLLVIEFFEYEACVVSTESESVADGIINLSFLCMVESEVHFRIELWVDIVVFVVDGRWYDIVSDGEYGCDCFERSCGSEQVSCHRFSRTYVEFKCMLSEESFDGFCFCYISERC